MIDPDVISTTGAPGVTACNPHPRRGAPYPREVWVDRPVWGLGVRQACDPRADLGGGGRRPRREPSCRGGRDRAGGTMCFAPPPEYSPKPQGRTFCYHTSPPKGLGGQSAVPPRPPGREGGGLRRRCLSSAASRGAMVRLTFCRRVDGVLESGREVVLPASFLLEKLLVCRRL